MFCLNVRGGTLLQGAKAAIYSIIQIEFAERFPKVISQKAKYALRALVALARAGDSMMIGEIAEAERIPRKFLEQILLVFARVATSARDVLDRTSIADAVAAPEPVEAGAA